MKQYGSLLTLLNKNQSAEKALASFTNLQVLRINLSNGYLKNMVFHHLITQKTLSGQKIKSDYQIFFKIIKLVSFGLLDGLNHQYIKIQGNIRKSTIFLRVMNFVARIRCIYAFPVCKQYTDIKSMTLFPNRSLALLKIMNYKKKWS